MIKDVIVSLSGGGPRDVAADYALSLGAPFEMHAEGIAFAYEPVVPGTVFGGLPYDLMEASRAEGRKAAEAAVARFDKAAGNAGVASESRVVQAPVVGAAEGFGRIARRHDLALVPHADPANDRADDPPIHAPLF